MTYYDISNVIKHLETDNDHRYSRTQDMQYWLIDFYFLVTIDSNKQDTIIMLYYDYIRLNKH